MNCPYPDCTKKNLKQDERCSQCGRRVKCCIHCHGPNRMLAVYCRSCGRTIPDLPAQWCGFKGGGERQGLNADKLPGRLQDLNLEKKLAFKLKAACLDLLFFDGCLVAVSVEGDVIAIDLERSSQRAGVRVPGRIGGHSCVAQGILYLAEEDRITAVTLAGLAMDPPNLRQLWGVPLEVRPINALLVHDGTLFFNAMRGEKRSLYLLDASGPRTPSEAEAPGDVVLIDEAETMSPPVGIPAAGRVAYFRQRGGEVELCSIGRAPASGEWQILELRRVSSPGSLLEDRYVGSVGRKVFGVFGEEDILCRYDEARGRFDQKLCGDARAFALAGLRGGVVIQTNGLYFLPHGHVETSADMMLGQPVILRDRLVAVGLGDGRLRIHDLGNPANVEHQRIGPHPVSAIASQDNLIAAGAEDGSVKLFRIELAEP